MSDADAGSEDLKDEGKPAQQRRADPEAGPAMYGCPVCRKDHILDLDRLQVSADLGLGI